MTYSTTGDMLIGDVFTDEPLKQKHVDMASDEVDSKLGFKYPTPFAQNAVSHPAWVLIKRVANCLASGRFLLEADQSGEESGVHAYGKSLVDEANSVIKMILDGDIDLSLPSTGQPAATGPHALLVGNVDPYDMVEAFYGWAARPPYPASGPFGTYYGR